MVKKVFGALLDAMKDYNTDRRGDVGSWSRIASMISMEKLVFLAIKASNIPQSSPRVLTDSSTSENTLFVPSLKMRLACLEPDAGIKARNCFVENKPLRKYHEEATSIFFDDELCAKVIGAMLKQLSEKLDLVRNEAGSCLQRLLTSKTPAVPFVSHRKLLVEALLLNKNEQINWASPETTFPLVMRAINIDTFFDSILSGLVISVGGLTESVQKSSSKAFLEYIRALKTLRTVGKVARVGHGLIRIFDEYSKDARVILPLLLTVDRVLSYGCFDTLLCKPDNGFAKELGLRVRREATRCFDIKRLMAIVPVALNILHCDKADVQEIMLLFLMRLLVHKYPRIRRHTAEQLYVKLIEDDTVVPGDKKGIPEATDILSETQWDRDLGPPDNIREIRNKVANLLNITLSEKDLLGPTVKKTVKKTDEFASYASLVQTAGF